MEGKKSHFQNRETTPTNIGREHGIETPTSLFRNPNLDTIGRPNQDMACGVDDPVLGPNLEYSSMEPRGISLLWIWEVPLNIVAFYYLISYPRLN